VTSVAVVIPTFNRLSLLKETIDSLLLQTHPRCEFILVDDASNDDTRQFLAELPAGDSRFSVIDKPPGSMRGAQSSRNIGLDAVTADYVMFLDSDDLLTPSCISDRVAAMRANPQADMIVGRQAIVDSTTVSTCWVNVPDTTRNDLDRFLAFSHPIDVPWVNGGILIRTERLRAAKVRWRPEFHWDDVAFHFEILSTGLRATWMSFDREPDSYYRMHDEERYGAMLSTAEGLQSTASMIVWMTQTLDSRDLLNQGRRRALAFTFFNSCFLVAVDKGELELAGTLLEDATMGRVVSSSDRHRMATYLTGRSLFRSLPRATYFWNRSAEKIWMRPFVSRARSTYGSISTNSPFPFASQ
jgi:glycosyltransferase involved in cell wall biosynthesis